MRHALVLCWRCEPLPSALWGAQARPSPSRSGDSATEEAVDARLVTGCPSAHRAELEHTASIGASARHTRAVLLRAQLFSAELAGVSLGGSKV